MICLGELAVECTILVLGLAVLLAIIPVNALTLLLEIKIAIFAALLLKKEPSQLQEKFFGLLKSNGIVPL